MPPHSLEAERAVLGAILLERESLPKAVELLRPSDFYKEGHRKIFDTMIVLFERNEPVDLLTLSAELSRAQVLDDVGGRAALAGLVEEAATSAHLLAYGGIVREKALLRDLIRIATEIISESYEAREDVDKLLDDAERLIFQISERRMQGSAIPVRAILKDTFEHIERLYERKEHVTGLATGFVDLDRLTSGFQSSDFIIIAGRPSMGKTAFALNIARYAARRAAQARAHPEPRDVQGAARPAAPVHGGPGGFAQGPHRLPRAAGLDAHDPRRRPPRRGVRVHRRLAGAVGARGAREGAPDEGRARARPPRHRLPAAHARDATPRTASRRSPRSRAR